MSNRRVLVTGSRDWDDLLTLVRALREQYDELGPYTLVHGTARGADSMAADVISKHGVGCVVEAHPADWNRHGKRAGFIRNSEMVALGADVCLAFIRNNSKGASMAADLAEKAGIRTVRYEA